jgi:3'-5' exonuclease
LELLAAVLGIQSSKDEIDGSQVNATFYHENDLEKIKQYCLRDVEVTARVFLAMNPQPETLEIELIPQEDSRKDHTD